MKKCNNNMCVLCRQQRNSRCSKFLSSFWPGVCVNVLLWAPSLGMIICRHNFLAMILVSTKKGTKSEHNFCSTSGIVSRFKSVVPLLLMNEVDNYFVLSGNEMDYLITMSMLLFSLRLKALMLLERMSDEK